MLPTVLHSAEWFLPVSQTSPGCPGPACPGPIFPDYSDAMKAEFCLGSVDPKCQLPTPNARQHVTLGQAAGEPQRMNLFLAERIAAAIGGLASASKEISGGSILTLSYYVSTPAVRVSVAVLGHKPPAPTRCLISLRRRFGRCLTVGHHHV